MAAPLLGSTSRLARNLACPAACILREEARPPGKAAARGTRIHRFLELAPEDKELALRAAGPNKRTCEKIDVTTIAGNYTPIDLRERPFVFHADTVTATALDKPDRERDYGKLREEDVPGTADVVIVGFSTVEVVDYKTGRHPVFPRDPDTGKPNTQLLHLATMVGMSIAKHAKQFVLTIQQLMSQGRFKTTSTTVDRFDVEEHAERVHKHLDVVRTEYEAYQNGTHPKTVVGNHCQYCPAQLNCPEWS